MKQCELIVDMQYGSCGKGLVSGYRAIVNHPDVVVNANMQNSGHTFIDVEGRKFVFKCLPNSIVSPDLKAVLMGPGSVIDLDVLAREIEENADLLEGKSLVIHPTALLVTDQDVKNEKIYNRVGSTQTGNASTMQRRMARDINDNPCIGNVPYDHPCLRRKVNIG